MEGIVDPRSYINGRTLGLYSIPAPAPYMVMGSVTPFCKLASHVVRGGVNTPRFPNWNSLVALNNRLEAIHTAIKDGGEEAVLHKEPNYTGVLPIEAVTWPLYGNNPLALKAFLCEWYKLTPEPAE